MPQNFQAIFTFDRLEFLLDFKLFQFKNDQRRRHKVVVFMYQVPTHSNFKMGDFLNFCKFLRICELYCFIMLSFFHDKSLFFTNP